MFLRKKKAKNHTYLQIVESRWEDGKTKQRVVTTLGRLDRLQESGQLDRLVQSAARFAEAVMVVSAHERGETPIVRTLRIGPALVFERLWRDTGCQSVIEDLLGERGFEFPVERAIFTAVLNRLVAPGSDRACDRWREAYRIDGAEELQLHHYYRAMVWLGEELAEEEQDGNTVFSPRCTKDRLEEALLDRRRDLFSSLEVVFFDTTSLYFEGEGGQELGERGHSKDHRPDLKQMVVGVVLDNWGLPVCCEMWPGNTTDVKVLIPIVDRLRNRFAIGRVCVVADRGMISNRTIRELEERGLSYILGVRMRAFKEAREEVLARAGRYRVVRAPKTRSKDPSPLKVKEVWVDDRRYVVCLNEEQKQKDEADREAIVASLREALRKNRSLVGNKGYRRYLAAHGQAFRVDEDKIEREARYDGKWVLRTNTNMDAAVVALKYKQLWMVEDVFRTSKSLFRTRPIFHRNDATIRGHVFCSFLALVLRTELEIALAHHGYLLEWADIVRDLDQLTEVDLIHDRKHFRLRSECKGVCGKLFKAAGVALPPTVRQVAEVATA